MNKKARSADLHAAISELATLYEYGELRASTDPAGLLREVAAEVRRLRQRTAPEETVLRAAVAWRQGKLGPTLTWLSNDVDALLAAEPAWGEGE